MERLKWALTGLIIGLAPMGCAAVGYHYYGMTLPDVCYEQGILLGPKPKDDIPFSTCKPDAHNKGKCVVQFQDEFFRLLQDDQDCHADLSDCQMHSGGGGKS